MLFFYIFISVYRIATKNREKTAQKPAISGQAI